MQNIRKRYRACLSFAVVAAILFSVWGCNVPNRNRVSVKRYTVSGLINIIESNISKIKKIRCKGGSITIKLPPEEKSRRFDLSGLVLLYQQPRDFYMSANILGQPKLYVGSNEQRYWIGVIENKSTLRWGYWKNADRECNRARTGPEKLLEAFGVVNLKDTNYIGPFLQVRNHTNVLLYGKLSVNSGEWYFAKEIHITETEPIVIKKIVYFTERNEKELIIDLSGYRKLSSGGYIPSRIELYWPKHESFMKIRLGKITIPNSLPPSAFEFPNLDSYDVIEQLDKDCK